MRGRHIAYHDPRYERGNGRGYGDADRHGIPNRRDPVYSPRWDRDGDGVPNRYDARPDDPRYSRGWQEAQRDWRDDRRDDRRDGPRGYQGD